MKIKGKLRIYVCLECFQASNDTEMESNKTGGGNYKLQCPKCSSESFNVYVDKKY